MKVRLQPSKESVRRNFEALARPAKILGITVLSALTGYATAKGFQTYIMPVEPSEAYEAAVTVVSALLGGFVAAEAIDR